MKIKMLIGSTAAVGLMGLGILTGSASAQTPAATSTAGQAAPTAPGTTGTTTKAAITQQQVGSHMAGWFQFQPLWARIVREQPDLLE